MLTNEEYQSIMENYPYIWNYNLMPVYVTLHAPENEEELENMEQNGYSPKGTWIPLPPYSIVAPMQLAGITGIRGLFFLVYSPALKWFIPNTTEYNDLMIEEGKQELYRNDWRRMFFDSISSPWRGLGNYIENLAIETEKKSGMILIDRLAIPFTDTVVHPVEKTPTPDIFLPMDEETLRREMKALDDLRESLKRKQDDLEKKEEVLEKKARKIEEDRKELREEEEEWTALLKELGVDPEEATDLSFLENPKDILTRIPPRLMDKMRKRITSSLENRMEKLSLEEKSDFFIF